MAAKDALSPRYNHSASSSDQSVVSSAGPLQQLRMASLASDTHSPEKNKLSKYTRDTDTKARSGSKLIKSRKSVNGAGFGFDLEFPVAGGRTSKLNPTCHEGTTLTDSSQMATIFLTSAKSLKSKFNVIDSIPPKDVASFSKQGEGTHVRISPSARRRADIIKYTLELKYTWIQKVSDPSEDDGQALLGIDRTYNPLQVLRNRATRKKLHQTLPSPSQYPLPCDAFSSHHSRGGRPWKMLWGIDLNELVADYAWRKVHWAELRDAKGNLWYPDAPTAHVDDPKSRRVSQRLHDKLWNDTDSDSHQSDNQALELPFQGFVKESGVKGIRNNLKEKAKKLYVFQSSSAVDLRALDGHYHATSKSLDGPALLKMTRMGENQPANASDQLYQFKLGGSGELRDSSSLNVLTGGISREDVRPPPQIIIGDEDSPEQRSDSGYADDVLYFGKSKDENSADQINEVNFSSAHLKSSSVHHLEHSFVSATPESVEAGPQHPLVSDDGQLSSLRNSMKLLDVVRFASSYYLNSVYPTLLKSTDSKLDSFLQKDMSKLSRAINQVNAGLLPTRENLYRGFIEEAKSITHIANDDCAVKIDNLLSATDRSYGELNTSLVMELRKTNERLDNLNRSLFSGVIGSSSLIDDKSQNLDMTNHRLLYIALENGIVIFLRLVWIGVNLCKPIIIFVQLLWKFFALIFK